MKFTFANPSVDTSRTADVHSLLANNISLNILINGRKNLIQRCVNNLIDNAIKYGEENSRVKLILETDGSNKNVKISVVNSGEGIDEIHLPRLTERFYRIDKARTRKLGGTGLGLAIVKHIMNRHRGRLQIISEGNGEIVFTVYFPTIRA